MGRYAPTRDELCCQSGSVRWSFIPSASKSQGKSTGLRTPGSLTSHPTNHQCTCATPGVLVSTACTSLLITRRSLAYFFCSSSGKRWAGLRTASGSIEILQNLTVIPGYLCWCTPTKKYFPFKFTRSAEALKKYPGNNHMCPNRLDNCRVIILARSTRALHLGTILRLNATRGAFFMLICTRLLVGLTRQANKEGIPPAPLKSPFLPSLSQAQLMVQLQAAVPARSLALVP